MKADYQGKSKFEGNQITKILNNLDKLKEVLTEEQTPFYDGFENLRKFKIAHKPFVHQHVNKRFMSSNYFDKNVDNPSHGEKLLKRLKHINSYNATTK